ncbi:membrane protein [Algimonas arctica]|uniref:Membrane protein n=1 Tax=Algimonas arctica TaxID=1479486 RepID=A0A8J3CPM4_9PROT|nr:AbgT family transporter [Algimonas arctica]GHA86441.1 membrane protein [Algimonas arctica]
MTDTIAPTPSQKGFLAWVERTGNRLPDPVFIFFYLILFLVIVSVVLAFMGATALHPTQVNADGSPVVIKSASLLSAENIQRLWVEMPKTFTHFHPLGYVLVVMLGAGVAERSGLFAAGIRQAVRGAPLFLLTPVVALVAMLSNHAADAGYVVMIPLAAILFASVGRHPLAGIAAAFAGVSGGFSANISPGQLDALLFGITEAAVDGSGLDPNWAMNIAGNWWFIVVLMFIYLPVIWFVTDKIIEPRLGKWVPDDRQAADYGNEAKPLNDDQRKGLRRAGLAMLAVCALWAAMTFGPGTPLLSDETAVPGQAWYVTATPFFRSLVAGFMILFLAAGWAYGSAAGSIKNHRDLVDMMAEAMRDMGYYLVLAFAAAHFVAMFTWSNLGLISAIHGANGIENSGLPLPIALGLIVLFTGLLNLFVGSASAKWALLAPVLVPMLMLLGISPEGATAAYRVGDGATNIITPLMVYFPLILVFARRWQKDFGLGSLTAMMIPYSVWMLISGVILMVAWIAFGLDLGPGAPMSYSLPG